VLELSGERGELFGPRYAASTKSGLYTQTVLRHYSFGNVRERPFSAIWTDLTDPVMAKLKEKKKYVGGAVRHADGSMICAGYFPRPREGVGCKRATLVRDPQCYLRMKKKR
jgi:MoaA/NifB/PqqE/SkfB family radical SAM enzyme